MPQIWSTLQTQHGFPRRGVERVILSFGTFEKVKLYEARHLFKITVARRPDVLESCFGAFDHFEAVHCDEHVLFSCSPFPIDATWVGRISAVKPGRAASQM